MASHHLAHRQQWFILRGQLKMLSFTRVHVFTGSLKKELLMDWLIFWTYFLNSMNEDQNTRKKLHNLIPTDLKFPCALPVLFQCDYWLCVNRRGTSALQRGPGPRILASEDCMLEPVPVTMVSCCWPGCGYLGSSASAQGGCGSVYKYRKWRSSKPEWFCKTSENLDNFRRK